MKSYLQKAVAWLLIITLLGSGVLSPKADASSSESFRQQEKAEGAKETEIIHDYQVNPLHQMMGMPIVEPQKNATIAPRTYSGTQGTHCTSIAQAGRYVREQMKQRAGTIQLIYETSHEQTPSADAIFQEAFVDTGVPTEGDYLMWQWSVYNAQTILQQSVNGIHTYSITYAVSYYTTAAQEQSVTAKVNAVLAGLPLAGKTDYEKIRIVYDYICQNVTYDHANLNNDAYKLKYTAYAALINKTAVCQGFALLFYRMMRELKIDVRLIAGIGGGDSHAWNLVRLGNQYYNLDATWDEPRFKRGLPYQYFLKGEPEFGRDHFRNSKYRTTAFMSAFPVSFSNYRTSAAGEHQHHYGAPQFQWSPAGKSCVAVFRCVSGDDVRRVTCTVTRTSLLTDSNSGSIVCTASASCFGGVYTSETVINPCPAKAVIRYIQPVGIDDAEIRWTPQPGVSGYQIIRRDRKKGTWKEIARVGGYRCNYFDRNLKCGKEYFYSVLAYRTLEDETYYGSYSDAKYLKARPAYPTVKSKMNRKGTSVKVTWKKVKGASGYQIGRSTKKRKNYYLVKTISRGGQTAWTDTNLRKKKKYYYIVRAYKKVKGKKIYGDWSPAVRARR